MEERILRRVTIPGFFFYLILWCWVVVWRSPKQQLTSPTTQPTILVSFTPVCEQTIPSIVDQWRLFKHNQRFFDYRWLLFARTKFQESNHFIIGPRCVWRERDTIDVSTMTVEWSTSHTRTVLLYGPNAMYLLVNKCHPRLSRVPVIDQFVHLQVGKALQLLIPGQFATWKRWRVEYVWSK